MHRTEIVIVPTIHLLLPPTRISFLLQAHYKLSDFPFSFLNCPSTNFLSLLKYFDLDLINFPRRAAL